MDRRSLLKAGTLAGLAALMPRPSLAAAATGPVNVYTGSDANVSDFWTNEILPRFAKAHPQWSTRMVDAGDGAGLRALADRALAALASNTDPQVEMFEGFDALQTKGALEAGLWVDFAKAGLTNAGRMNPAAHQTDFDLAYRGSQVLLAYDATRVKPEAAPKTWAALTAWIKANPGQFIYNRPDKGGSGGNFVRRAIHEANGRDPSKFTLANFSPDYAEASLAPAWKLLADLAPDLYEGGAYTSGNTQTLQMLGQGVVSMAPVWSDQVLQAIAQGVLPEDTGLVQLQDLALCGGFSRITVPVNAAQKEAALALADFLLSEEIQSLVITGLGGFPGVGWEHVDPALKAKYADVIPASIPTFPAGPWDSAISDGWYRNVAPGVSRG